MGERQATEQTYYEILEIRTNAGPTEIYNAYQKARATYSPSSPALYSMFSPEEAKQLLALIEEAYQTLSHQARRKEYDIKVGLAQQPAPLRSTKTEAPVKYDAETARKKVEDAWVGSVKTSPGMRKNENLPQGYAKTKFSIYEVKPEVEKEIAEIQECDGQFLQKIRLYKGVSPEQMSEEIRITRTALAYLENNEMKMLPVAVFTRGFVVNISRVLGLDQKKMSDAYMKFFKAKKSG
jgi:cytoskeletal protein RodZ